MVFTKSVPASHCSRVRALRARGRTCACITFHWDIGTLGRIGPGQRKGSVVGGVPMRIFPAWMYGDPAIAAERLERVEARSQERAELRKFRREQEFEQMRRTPIDSPRAGSSRIVFAPPEIRVKQARIQALLRAALRARRK